MGRDSKQFALQRFEDMRKKEGDWAPAGRMYSSFVLAARRSPVGVKVCRSGGTERGECTHTCQTHGNRENKLSTPSTTGSSLDQTHPCFDRFHCLFSPVSTFWHSWSYWAPAAASGPSHDSRSTRHKSENGFSAGDGERKVNVKKADKNGNKAKQRGIKKQGSVSNIPQTRGRWSNLHF